MSYADDTALLILSILNKVVVDVNNIKKLRNMNHNHKREIKFRNLFYIVHTIYKSTQDHEHYNA